MTEKQLHKEVRDRIIKKFGTIGKFCRCTSIDRVQMQKDLYCEKLSPNGRPERTARFNLYSRLIKEHSPIEDPNSISVELRGKIDDAIKSKGGVKKFCSENPFVLSSTYSVISGRNTRMTDRIRRLCDYLEIEYDKQ